MRLGEENTPSFDLIPLLSSFAVVALAEFGDKTQIAIISLSAEHKPRSIFLGAMLAFAVIDGILALIGRSIASQFPVIWIDIASGILFLIIGIYTLFSKRSLTLKIKEHSNAVVTSFLLIGVLEFGDKTQLAVITLAATYNAPLQVFVGVMLAFALLTSIAIAFGKVISGYVSERYLKIGSGLLFIFFGLLFLAEAIMKIL